MTDAAWSLYAEEVDNVDGWFFEADVKLFSKLLASQTAEGITGDMLEIGAYQGKSAILLGYGLRDDEELVICDLFDAVMEHADMSLIPRQQYSGLDQQQFLANWDRFHARRPTLEVCESSRLDLGERALRFVHIDGCHSYRCVANDIALAVTHTAKRGVIAIDDYRGVETPGVAAAVWQAVGNGRLFPFAATYMKIYACTSPADQSFWSERVQDCADICALPDFELPSYRSVSESQIEPSVAKP
ncbi:class I SAM-dependent methyltransferase [Mycobacterium sp. HNNTM2301]|uniref:class I SAM-dependent methyltransferase n=1 Tax=Mycobacterium hainanense TaxID=3289775 RepID=UPI0035A5FB59